MLALVGTKTSPLTCGLAIMTSALLVFSQVKFRTNALDEITVLIEGPLKEEHFGLLVGFAWGLSISNTKLRKYVGDVKDGIKPYRECIDVLTSADREKLRKVTKELWKLILQKKQIRK